MILEDTDWAAWLGETDAAPEQLKAVLRTMEGANWKMEREAGQRKPAETQPTLF